MERLFRPAATVAEPAPFMRRVLAAFIDTVLLTLCFLFIVIPFQGRYAPESLLAQAAIAFAYTALFNSRLGGGGTIGKRLTGLRVVARNGEYIALPRALLRASVDVLPSVLGIYIPILIPWTTLPIAEAGAAAGVGFGLANLYLYAVNWRTRQVLHDLVANTFVIKDAVAVQPFEERTPGAHIAFAAVLVPVITLVWTLATLHKEAIDGPALCDKPVTQALTRLAIVERAYVNRQPTNLTRISDPDHTTILAFLRGPVAMAGARQIARTAIAACPAFHGERRITLLLVPKIEHYSLKSPIRTFWGTVDQWRGTVSPVPDAIPKPVMALRSTCDGPILAAVETLPFVLRAKVSEWPAIRPEGTVLLKQVYVAVPKDHPLKPAAWAVARKTLKACPALAANEQLEIIIGQQGDAKFRPEVFGGSIAEWRTRLAQD